MSKRKPSNGLIVTDLTRAYTEYKTVLVRRAARKVQNHVIAEEIVQDAFLKLMLAAPELKSQDHLLAYLNKSIDNLAINHGTKLSNRADLIAIDSEATQAEVDVLLATNVNDELSADLIRAEDASIVREAISRMTPADRDILLLSEFEGLSAEAIAAQFGMSTSTVRSSLTRARHSLRKILEEWIVDEETGMTAAQYLSRTGKKIAENSKKIGSAALSLAFLVAAFFGFWNNPSTPANLATPTTTSTPPQVQAAAPTTTTPEATASAQATPAELQTWAINYLSKASQIGWPGLDSKGLPVGYTVNNGAGLNGLALITQDPFEMDTTNGTVSTQSRFTTFQDGLNVILNQIITNKFGKVSYEAMPMVRVGGSWIALEIASSSVDVKQLADGSFSITSVMIVDLEKTAQSTPIAGGSLGGSDLSHIPAVISTRLLTTAIGSPVTGQAVQVLDPLAGRS